MAGLRGCFAISPVQSAQAIEKSQVFRIIRRQIFWPFAEQNMKLDSLHRSY
jgi:hypothetical protein